MYSRTKKKYSRTKKTHPQTKKTPPNKEDPPKQRTPPQTNQPLNTLPKTTKLQNPKITIPTVTRVYPPAPPHLVSPFPNSQTHQAGPPSPERGFLDPERSCADVPKQNVVRAPGREKGWRECVGVTSGWSKRGSWSEQGQKTAGCAA
ncbi:hypothetical protein E6O75_ATG10869 [Venturia nashicola]|uniref:Uncharacterized protein n=1 Tax=Venturia nashicola TaxID=86259 RepID=A0A4Z1P2I7_9PEZI|nr:hypothetical protein E6O75_ATG10869 [Venturia nashicola]